MLSPMRPATIRNSFGGVRSTRESRANGRNSSSGVDCGMIATARAHCRPIHPKRGCPDPRISSLLHLLRTLSRVGALDGEQVEEVGGSLERGKGAYLQKPVQAQLALAPDPVPVRAVPPKRAISRARQR